MCAQSYYLGVQHLALTLGVFALSCSIGLLAPLLFCRKPLLLGALAHLTLLPKALFFLQCLASCRCLSRSFLAVLLAGDGGGARRELPQNYGQISARA